MKLEINDDIQSIKPFRNLFAALLSISGDRWDIWRLQLKFARQVSALRFLTPPGLHLITKLTLRNLHLANDSGGSEMWYQLRLWVDTTRIEDLHSTILGTAASRVRLSLLNNGNETIAWGCRCQWNVIFHFNNFAMEQETFCNFHFSESFVRKHSG